MERRRATTIVTIGIRNRRQFNLAERTVFAGGRYFWSESIIVARTKLLAAISTAYQYAGCANRRCFSVLSVPYSTASVIRSRSLSLSFFLFCSPFSHPLSFLYSFPLFGQRQTEFKISRGMPAGSGQGGDRKTDDGQERQKTWSLEICAHIAGREYSSVNFTHCAKFRLSS